MLEVVCYLRCPVCKHKAVGVTQASAEREVDAYLRTLDNLPLPKLAEAYRRRSPSLYSYKYCLHCQKASEDFLPATIKSKRTRAKAQYVVAPAIPFAVPDELRFSPHE